ncbi:hypothetical protein VNO78_12587 [Psophocarpus tetragonolobus]|uniref:Uncharacterized protein n=1 Tax=Psophocarpus tetragonolobus TaxID=3891 RepID=A0AAN9SR10_PSOTE
MTDCNLSRSFLKFNLMFYGLLPLIFGQQYLQCGVLLLHPLVTFSKSCFPLETEFWSLVFDIETNGSCTFAAPFLEFIRETPCLNSQYILSKVN